MRLFRKTDRIPSARLCGKDYAEAGMYLVTVCTRGLKHWFGEVQEERMVLNAVGKMVEGEIQRTSLLRGNVLVDVWVVMPNHVHMIMEILPVIETDTVETCRRHVSADNPPDLRIPSIQSSSKSPCSRNPFAYHRSGDSIA